MFNYKTLEHTNIEMLHQTFVDAFSDYQVKIDLPFWKFQNMLKRRGYVPEISMGAFKDDILVGFVLNGLRSFNGMKTVYDLGTGVVGQYRKQGITNNMLKNINELFREQGIEQYLLEVIKTNISAFDLYKKQGFEIIRSFSCFQTDKNKFVKVSSCNVEHVDKFNAADWELLKKFWDFEPSWQNSVDSINAVTDAFSYSVVRIDNKIVGYGIIEKRTGDIPQLAVDKNYRNKGIAGSLVADLLKNTESTKLSVLNVDDNIESTKNFLSSSGFDFSVGQYEMILNFKICN